MSGVTLSKSGAGASAWDTQAFTAESLSAACVLRFSFPIAAAVAAAGLNTDPGTDANYTSIDYCLRANADSTVSVYESGTLMGNYGVFLSGDLFEIEYIGTSIRYKKNGAVFHTLTVSAGLTLYVDSAIYTPVGAIANVRFGVYSAASNISGQITPTNSATFISANAIDSAQIGTLYADKIVSGSLGTLREATNASVSVPDATSTKLLALTIPLASRVLNSKIAVRVNFSFDSGTVYGREILVKLIKKPSSTLFKTNTIYASANTIDSRFISGYTIFYFDYTSSGDTDLEVELWFMQSSGVTKNITDLYMQSEDSYV